MKTPSRTSRTFPILTWLPLIFAIAGIILGSSQTAFAATISTAGTTGDLVAYAEQQAQANGLDPSVFVRQVQEESGFNLNAVSVSGAMGIAQIIPANQASVNAWDPYASLTWMAQLDASYLAQLGSYDLMLAAYNAGPHVVTACLCVPPYPQTLKYVRDILGSSSAPSALPGLSAIASSIPSIQPIAPGSAFASPGPLPGRPPGFRNTRPNRWR